MAYYNKIGLLILSEDSTKFLVVRKNKNNVTDDYILPGGQFEEETEEMTLVSEIREELDTRIDLDSLGVVGTYEDVAAGRPDRDVSIKLYKGKILDEPKASTEIESLHWIGVQDIDNPKVSPIIRNKILPDLISRNILRYQ